MSFSHILGTAILLFHVTVNGQFRRRIPGGGMNFPPGPGTGGGGRQAGFGVRGVGGFPGRQAGFNVPPPPGFMQLNRLQNGNALPRGLQNALPRNALGGAAGVNSVLGNRGGFGNRFMAARGQELTRQLSPAPPGTFGGFAGGGAGQNFPGLNRVQGQPPNIASQVRPGMNFRQQVPGAVGLQAARGVRNQPQAVMPRRVGAIDLSSVQPGQRFGNEIQPRAQNFAPQTAQVQPTRFARPNTFSQQPPPQTQGTFGVQQSFGTRTVVQAQPATSVQTGPPAQGIAQQPSFAFPQQTITQPIGVGRPAAQTNVPQGAPQLLPGEIEIAPPITPAAAAAIQGGGTGNAPPSVSEIITISDINGNVLYRGVDLSDTEIEKITQQLVNNMSDAQANEAAKRAKELEAQGKLDTVGNPLQLPTGQVQASPSTGQQASSAQSSGGFSAAGFTSWGQQSGVRFPGQENVVGESRTVVNLMNPTNGAQSG